MPAKGNFSMVNNQESQDIPRFVVTIVDTKTKVQSPKGEEFLSRSAASDHISDFLKPYTKKQTASRSGAKNEIESMFGFFTDDLASETQEVIPKGEK
jgi:hypothetical protein